MTNNKDPSITELLDRLDLNKRGWCIHDHWEADRCAIGLCNLQSDDCLAYVSTFNLAAGRYDCECEKRSPQSSLGYEVTHQGQNLTFSELATVLESHLNSDR